MEDGVSVSRVGPLLKQKRKEMGLTIDDMSHITKIHKRYLVAIEAGRWEELPGPVYTRAFLRLIAQRVELDPQYVMEQYQYESVGAEPEDDAAPPRRRKRKRRNVKTFALWCVLFLFLALFAYGILFALRLIF